MPNNAKLGVYLAPAHDPKKWKEYLFRVDPPIVRILMPGEAPTQLVSDVFALCPKARISLRWWDIDDGGDGNKASKLKDEQTARDAAMRDYDTYMNRFVKMNLEAANKGLPFPSSKQALFNTLNEPPIDEGKWKESAAYSEEFVGYASSQGGPHVMVAEFGVGHPSTWPPEWGFMEATVSKFTSGDILAVHEYWQPEGPFNGEDWGALAGRYQHIPFSCPIVITECGVDGRIYGKHQPPDTGYAKFMSPEFFTGQLGTYLAQVIKDPRIVAVLPFTTDFQDKEWASFDTLPCLPYIAKVLGAFHEQDFPTPPATTTPPAPPKPASPDILVDMVEHFNVIINQATVARDALLKELGK